MKNFIKKAARFISRNSDTILAILGSIGVVGVAYSASKDGIKASAHIKQAEAENDEPLTLVEKIDVSVMDYVPTALTVLATLSCIALSSRESRKKQMALASAYTMTRHVHDVYQNKVKELDPEIDKQANGDVLTVCKQFKIDDYANKNLFYEKNYGGYFESTMADIYQAEMKLNHIMVTTGQANLGMFYEFLGFKYINPKLYDLVFDCEDMYWIYVSHDYVTVDEGLTCCCLEFMENNNYI